MRVLLLRCGDHPLPVMDIPGIEIHQLGQIPSRRDLSVLDEAATDILPADPTPPLDEIAAQPDVAHLSTPMPAPQTPFLPQGLRVIVAGSDAALSAVLTRMMRGDYLWAEVALIPVPGSTVARNWGLPESPADALELALTGSVRPAPLIRNDLGIAVAGSATISEWETGEITGEIVVDDRVLLRHQARPNVRFDGIFGIRLVPMTDAPGIAAVRAVSPVSPESSPKAPTPQGLRGRLASKLIRSWSPSTLQSFSKRPLGGWVLQGMSDRRQRLDADSLLSGRAVQAGGPALAVAVDEVVHRRPLERVTFYRHLRDLQCVRP
ncbi:hypothetical protein [Corynebacterium alimapuense]|uniref:DAGKc domain-containing protein n=1 Tax=Corynebacterium alimapuense TaxID=1576874 RepID=A0A3M8K9L7_9CORY|nr:hypothetical protein [Corynebacterium alimapuense]RNE49927.1 hypothetical protein C5L39_00700 [Corynebacterium alimapuense]